MNRFHVHVAVDDLEANIRFYSAVFGAEPSVKKDDYAKWMLEDPRINFAISRRGHPAGVNHLGIQVDSDGELDAMRLRLADAAISATTPGETACCYARSNKDWTTDPQGIAWETYHTLGSIPVFGQDASPVAAMDATGACCVPGEVRPTKQSLPTPVAAESAACCSR
jgi:catechol 2,3-dioxygenase-like lactoylglutathione lyase family enzyme